MKEKIKNKTLISILKSKLNMEIKSHEPIVLAELIK